LERFYGSGVYAIYYSGLFPAYQLISGKDHALYVGKADPETPDAHTVEGQGDRLSRRLLDHSRTILKAENLALEDFFYRYLVVKSGGQKEAEEYLINLFKPVWNSEMSVCFGFGKHGDSSDTRRNTRSPWDTLHPGREWAAGSGNVPNPKSKQQIAAEVVAHLKATYPVSL
jgi:hypothetical protein